MSASEAKLDRLRQAMAAVSSGERSPDEALAGLGSGFDPIESAPLVDPGETESADRLPPAQPPAVEPVEIEPGDAEPAATRTDLEWETLARTVVLRRLSVQARSRGELAESLAEAEVPTAIAERVLSRMGEVGLVDDRAFARDWVASRQDRKHLSRRMLLEELRRKRIDPDVAEQAVAGVGEAEEYDAAVALARRKLDGLARHPFEVQQRRLAGVLERRGFAPAMIRRVLDEVGVRVR